MHQLQQAIRAQYGYEDDEASHLVEQEYVAVFDNYLTGGPGYSGNVMIVVWDGGSGQYEAYAWNNKEMCFVEQER